MPQTSVTCFNQEAYRETPPRRNWGTVLILTNTGNLFISRTGPRYRHCHVQRPHPLDPLSQTYKCFGTLGSRLSPVPADLWPGPFCSAGKTCLVGAGFSGPVKLGGEADVDAAPAVSTWNQESCYAVYGILCFWRWIRVQKVRSTKTITGKTQKGYKAKNLVKKNLAQWKSTNTLGRKELAHREKKQINKQKK